MVNLTKLDCSGNGLISLDDCKNFHNLSIFECCSNEIESLDPIKNLTNLTELNCADNKLTSLDSIANLHNLIMLFCSQNNLTSLNGIEHLHNLIRLHCDSNNLTSLNSIINLRQLTEICYYNNPIDHIPPNIQRILDMQHVAQNIYTDAQNVHNHSIQESVAKSINNILQIKPKIKNVTELILTDQILTSETKSLLMEYSACADVHSTLNITFGELLIYVFNRIQSNVNSDEIKKILNIEMTDSVCKCFTGRIGRLINCLNGFDQLVQIKISDAEQIATVIKLVSDELISNNSYSVKLHKQLVTNRLTELGYASATIDLWVQNIE